MLLKRLQQRCDDRQANHQLREQLCLSHTTDSTNNSHQLFCNNNYLGLANHPAMIQALSDGAARYGVGSGASPLISGYSVAHREAEQAYADFFGAEDAMLFSNGFMANLSVIQALVARDDCVIHDRDNHASLMDATIGSRADLIRYKHVDMSHCEQRLLAAKNTPTLLVSDTVFSMSGDQAPLKELSDLARKHQATLMIDDSHGVGVLGEGGRGALNEAGLSVSDVDVAMFGLGKAMGCYGGIVLGSAGLIAGLRQFSRAYIYSTAIPPALAVVAKKAVELLQEESWRVEQLRELIDAFKMRANARGVSCLPSDTAIQTWVVGDEEKAVFMTNFLRQEGYLLTPIRTPTVPLGEARLRFTLNIGQTESGIDALLVAVERARDAYC